MLSKLKARLVKKVDKPIEISGINIQNIPSHCKEIRMLFKASCTAKLNEVSDDNTFTVPEYEEIETVSGWKFPRDLQLGDEILSDDGNLIVAAITPLPQTREYKLEFSYGKN